MANENNQSKTDQARETASEKVAGAKERVGEVVKDIKSAISGEQEGVGAGKGRGYASEEEQKQDRERGDAAAEPGNVKTSSESGGAEEFVDSDEDDDDDNAEERAREASTGG
ncbi:MAG: hypothetical protein ACR2NA_04140 [Solirubrobacterales bacterium]